MIGLINVAVMVDSLCVCVLSGGGRGIHRVLSNKKKTGETGERFKAKRAGGDLKKKGGVDPYAYLPLDRQKLNRR